MIETKKEFTQGIKYFMRSVCDYDCVWTAEVIKRTPKTVTILMNGTIKNCRVRVWDNVETIKPLGNYSMAPIMTAEKIA